MRPKCEFDSQHDNFCFEKSRVIGHFTRIFARVFVGFFPRNNARPVSHFHTFSEAKSSLGFMKINSEWISSRFLLTSQKLSDMRMQCVKVACPFTVIHTGRCIYQTTDLGMKYF